MIKKQTIMYPCFTGTEERRLYIYLPRGYHSSAQRHYPVLYMFDGQNLFFDDNATYGKSWGLGKYLSRTRTPLIVAALECNTHADNGRLSEYSPFYYNPQGEWGGPYEARAEETMQWFINTLKPYIDQNFRTLPDRHNTFLGGSSMGGLMSIYGVLAHNNVYSRAIALSPTLDVDIKALAKFIDHSKPASDTIVYMDYGSKEFEYEPWSNKNFGKITNKLLKYNVLVTSRMVLGGDHSEASWERQLPFAIPTLMYNL